uniref:Uncharacterized protein n=1 Tax=Oryza meridionalis TaxID=40149 RepID=A0A0E0CWB2_9ORYZ
MAPPLHSEPPLNSRLLSPVFLFASLVSPQSGSLVNSCEDGGQEWQICVPSYLYTALNVGLHREMLDIILQNW